ncbi:hypothetical protein ACOME3_002306 [Neoechinorhynchus agilis]
MSLSQLLARSMRVNLAGSALTKQLRKNQENFERMEKLMMDRNIAPSPVQPLMPFLGCGLASVMQVAPECNKQIRDALEEGCDPNDEFIKTLVKMRNESEAETGEPVDCMAANTINGLVKLCGKVVVAITERL